MNSLERGAKQLDKMMEAELAESNLSSSNKSVDVVDKDCKDDDKPSTAKALIDLALNHCDLFHDERNDGYAVTTHKGIRRTLKLRGKEFRRWFAGTYYATTEKAANNEALSTALSVLEAAGIE